MSNNLIFILAISFFILMTLCSNCDCDEVDFEDLALPAASFFDGYGADAATGSWKSGQASFNTNQFGPGWSYSNLNDTTTPGFANQWAAITGVGFGDTGNYALANSFSPNGAVINFPDVTLLLEVQVTNSTYAAISMRDGDAFGKRFGGTTGNDPDFLSVTFTGFTEYEAAGKETGSVDFYLADFRFSDNSLDYIVDQWIRVELAEIGPAKSLAISFDGSDVGPFGLNTPTYVAIDQLIFDSCVVGDVNQDLVIDLLDIGPFVDLLTTEQYQCEGDTIVTDG